MVTQVTKESKILHNAFFFFNIHSLFSLYLLIALSIQSAYLSATKADLTDIHNWTEFVMLEKHYVQFWFLQLKLEHLYFINH